MKMKFDGNYDFTHLYTLNTKLNQNLIRFLKDMISHKELYILSSRKIYQDEMMGRMILTMKILVDIMKEHLLCCVILLK